MLGIECLKKLKVDDFTTPCPIVINKNEKFSNVVNLMDEQGIRHLPVVENEKVIGIISDRDILRGLADHLNVDICVEQIMTKNPYIVGIDTSLDEVAFEMSQNKIGSAVIIDEHSQIYGIFTTTDALNALIEIVRGDLDL